MTIETAVARMKDRSIVTNRVDAAFDYAEVLLANWDQLGTVNVSPLITEMLSRWSLSGVTWIKRKGWRLAQDVEYLQARRRQVLP